jgi:6,7-dimethyl-8-ribityllumazine synthase
VRPTAQGPTCLYTAAHQAEQERHKHRVAELKDLEARLRMLDALVDALKAQGVTLHPDRLSNWPGTRDVYISAAVWDSSGQRLYSALIAVGFVIVRRSDHSSFASVSLKHGRLSVRITVDTDVLGPAPQPEAATASEAAS